MFDFTQSIFNDFLSFNNIKVEIIDLKNSVFYSTLDIHNIKNINKEELSKENILNRDTARNIKYHLEKS